MYVGLSSSLSQQLSSGSDSTEEQTEQQLGLKQVEERGESWVVKQQLGLEGVQLSSGSDWEWDQGRDKFFESYVRGEVLLVENTLKLWMRRVAQ